MNTIYFDTNFYIWFAIADEKVANEVIFIFNKFNVRIVLSLLLARELFSNRNPDLNYILHSRLKSLNIPSLIIDKGITWNILLSPSECGFFENIKQFTKL